MQTLPADRALVRVNSCGVFDPGGRRTSLLIDVKVPVDANGVWTTGLRGGTGAPGKDGAVGPRGPKGDPGELTREEADRLYATRAQGERADSALQPSDVTDSLTSTDTDKPLSAAAGRSLQIQIDMLSSAGATPTDITSATLSVGGSGFNRSINLFPEQVSALQLALSAVQPGVLHQVAFSGFYDHLSNKPWIPSIADIENLINEALDGIASKPTDITSVTLAVGGSGYDRTIELTPEQQAALSEIPLLDARITELENKSPTEKLKWQTF